MGHKFKTYFRTNKAYYPQISKTKSQTKLVVASAESRCGNACVEAKTADAEVKGDVGGYASWTAIRNSCPVERRVFPKEGTTAVADSGG